MKKPLPFSPNSPSPSVSSAELATKHCADCLHAKVRRSARFDSLVVNCAEGRWPWPTTLARLTQARKVHFRDVAAHCSVYTSMDEVAHG